MATIDKSRGDSITINIVTDETITLSDINEMVVYLGDKLSAKLSLEQLTQVDNVFTWKISSASTKNLYGINSITVSLDLDGYGNRKTIESTAPKIHFLENNNAFSDSAVSDDFIDVIINLGVVTGSLTVSETLFNAYFNLNYPKSIPVFGIGSGDILHHGMHTSDVYAQFISTDGQLRSGFYLQPIDGDIDNSTVKVPLLDGGIFASFTGNILIFPLQSALSNTKIFKLPDDIASIEDGSIIPHDLKGDVFLEFIQDGQRQDGFYGNNNTGTTVTFRTPEFEDNNDITFTTGYIKCTKLN